MPLRQFLRPRWLAFHLLCLGAVVAMANLGIWQAQRLEQRREFNASVEAVAGAPIIDYAAAARSGEADEYQRVRVSGEYLERTFTVVNVSQGGGGGRNHVGLLALDDGSILVVNRGFATGVADLPPLPSGTVDIVGRIRESQEPRRGQVRDDPAADLTEIRRIELAVLAQQVDQTLQPVYLEALLENGEPVPQLSPIAFPSLDEGPHLSYAIQWFVFGICVVVGWVLAVRRTARGPRASRKALIPEQYL